MLYFGGKCQNSHNRGKKKIVHAVKREIKGGRQRERGQKEGEREREGDT